MAGHNIDNLTKSLFKSGINGNSSAQKNKPDFEETLKQVAINGNLVSKTRESLVSVGRVLTFINQVLNFKADTDEAHRIKSISRDITALNDHASFLSGKVSFLLDATLGMINIEQNAIIKIFSVASVIFLPPTLIASIYGMNFHIIPELDLKYGYPYALLLMVLSAYLPYRFFKKKGWL